jgi:hypothetical protein
MMKIEIIKICDIHAVMKGMALSYNKSPHEMFALAKKTAPSGNLEFLRFMKIYLDVTASPDWWQQIDNNRIEEIGRLEGRRIFLTDLLHVKQLWTKYKLSNDSEWRTFFEALHCDIFEWFIDI